MEKNFDSLLNVAAVPPNDRTAAFIAESRENRSRCYEMSEQMTATVATDSQAFRQYLDLQSHFDRYAVNNVLLIMAQRPDAQRLGDYSYWRDQGAYIKRQERRNPVLILEPGKEYEREDGSIGTYYNAKKLYDISQTDLGGKLSLSEGGQEEAEPKEGRERKLIRALVSSPPAAIVTAEADQLPKGKGAYFEPSESCIYVRKGLDATAIFRSLSAELMFAGFADGRKDYNRGVDAFHAYCGSYMLCKKYGIDTAGFGFQQAPDMFDGMESQGVRAELSKVRDGMNKISARMERTLRSDRKQKAQPVQEQGGAR